MAGHDEVFLSQADLEVILSSPPFVGVPAEDAMSLLHRAAVVEYATGSRIFDEGEPVESFFMVLQGQVKVFKTAPGGSHNVLSVFHSGAQFALTALLGRSVYPASCETLESTRLLAVPYRDLLDGLAASPRLGLGMLRAVARRHRELTLEIAEVKGKSPLQRLVGFLLGLAGRREGKADIRLPYQRQVLAARIGIAPENLSRDFARLVPYGVTARGADVTIEDVARLQEIYSGRSGCPASSN